MSKPTHQILLRTTGKVIYLYDVKTHQVYELDGRYYTTMGPPFTEKVLSGSSPSYNFKRINVQLENK